MFMIYLWNKTHVSSFKPVVNEKFHMAARVLFYIVYNIIILQFAHFSKTYYHKIFHNLRVGGIIVATA